MTLCTAPILGHREDKRGKDLCPVHGSRASQQQQPSAASAAHPPQAERQLSPLERATIVVDDTLERLEGMGDNPDPEEYTLVALDGAMKSAYAVCPEVEEMRWQNVYDPDAPDTLGDPGIQCPHTSLNQLEPTYAFTEAHGGQAGTDVLERLGFLLRDSEVRKFGPQLGLSHDKRYDSHVVRREDLIAKSADISPTNAEAIEMLSGYSPYEISPEHPSVMMAKATSPDLRKD